VICDSPAGSLFVYDHDRVATPAPVFQSLLQQRMTWQCYGDVVTDEMAQANSKVVGLILSGTAN
jgi:hypothetical protein